MAGSPHALQASSRRWMLDPCVAEGAAAAATGSWEHFWWPVEHLGSGRSRLCMEKEAEVCRGL